MAANRFLIDECLSPTLADEAHNRGLEAYHVAYHGLRGAPDHEVLQAAMEQDLIVVTNNRDDFTSLVGKVDLHPGLIVLDGYEDRTGQVAQFKAALDQLAVLGDCVNKVIHVDVSLKTMTFELPEER